MTPFHLVLLVIVLALGLAIAHDFWASLKEQDAWQDPQFDDEDLVAAHGENPPGVILATFRSPDYAPGLLLSELLEDRE